MPEQRAEKSNVIQFPVPKRSELTTEEEERALRDLTVLDLEIIRLQENVLILKESLEAPESKKKRKKKQESNFDREDVEKTKGELEEELRELLEKREALEKSLPEEMRTVLHAERDVDWDHRRLRLGSEEKSPPTPKSSHRYIIEPETPLIALPMPITVEFPVKPEDAISLDRAIELLGRENVHGPDDVEFLLGFKPQDIPPVPYTEADLQKSLELKAQGIEEMLVLFVCDQDGTPLTGKRMNELIQQKYDELGLGKFLYAVDWYKDKTFYKELGLRTEWKLITKKCIPNSKNKKHHWEQGDEFRPEDTQEHVIDEFSQTHNIHRNLLHRPEPFQMLFAQALHLVSTEHLHRGAGECILASEYHWSDRSSSGYFVYVGYADADGAGVNSYSRGYCSNFIGVCLSRDSSL